MKNIGKFGIVLAAMLLAGVALAAPKKQGDKTELLSEHQTVAQFNGVAFHKCMGLTGACPDNCGSSGDYANFKVLAYLAYAKPGEYGDPKTDNFSFQVEDNHHTPKAPKEIVDTVKAMKSGDYVKLTWRHLYVTKGGSSYPERPVVLLEKITKEEAEKLIKEHEGK